MNHRIMRRIIQISLCCLFPVMVFGQAPDWTIDPSAFSNSMHVVGFLQLDGVESTDAGDLVAAFVGDEVRGVASPVYEQEVDRYLVILTVRSNSSSEEITFKAYDKSQDKIVDIVDQVTFVPDGFIGGLEASFIWSDVTLKTGASLFSYSLIGQQGQGEIVGEMVTVNVGLTTNLSSQIAEFTISEGATATVNGIDQVSGVTSNDFSNTITFKVQSENGLNVTNYSININVVNVSPTDIQISGSSVAENSAAGTIIGELNATDDEDDHAFTFAVGDGDDDNHRFEIDGNQLITDEVFDFETLSSFTVRLKAIDAANNSYEKAISIEVSDVNEAPSDISLSVNTIDENNAVGQTIGSFTSTDVDANDQHSYTLVEGEGSTDNGSFTISESGALQAVVAFDYESQTGYNIRVRSTDVVGLSIEKTFTIGILNLNETAIGIELSNSSILENQEIGSSVGTLTTVDPDNASDFTYQLVTGAGDSDNSAFEVVGDVLKTKRSFDFETKASYSIRVSSTDPELGSLEVSFTVTVIDDNDAPTSISLNNASVKENSALNTLVGTLSTDDQDEGDTHVYSFVEGVGDTHNEIFSLRSNNELVVVGETDFETNETLQVRLITIDENGLRFEQAFLIVVNNLPEAGISVSEEQIDFGIVNIGEPSGKTFMVNNTGPDGVLNITSFELPQGFSVNPTEASINPGEGLEFTLQFDPPQEGTIEDVMLISSNAGEVEIAITGEANVVTGIDDLPDVSGKVELWPNPSSNQDVTLDLTPFAGQSFSVTMLDLSGNVLKLAESQRSSRFTLSTRRIPSGLYVVVIRNSQRVAKKKLVIR